MAGYATPVNAILPSESGALTRMLSAQFGAKSARVTHPLLLESFYLHVITQKIDRAHLHWTRFAC